METTFSSSKEKIPRESSDHLQFDRNSNYFLAKQDWKREFLEMERQGQTGQRGPPLEVDHFERKNFHADQSVPFTPI